MGENSSYIKFRPSLLSLPESTIRLWLRNNNDGRFYTSIKARTSVKMAQLPIAKRTLYHLGEGQGC